ncbi:P-loop containing nucleoside triphosphate hydrolase protein [Exophiala viscosa]|uniref:DNA 3'-5' helicase n=1 Tax=Exophiala viscosa TaxID=2486360 RepID=A0AAN6I7U0_9EURO|nr:P-loop containing nucleoside triphosphate hydrolase protein [Exophiala viscosa]
MRFIKDKERVIVYVNSREDARILASELGCESFYSDLGSIEEKEQVTARWRDGVHRVIVATSAFGAGVDYAYVRVVVHLDMPRDAINFSQEVGRAGRDGYGGHSLVLLPSRYTPVSDETWERQRFSIPVSERVMQRYVGENRCLWATLSRFVDGPDQMQYCVADLECSVCLDRGFFRVGQEVDDTRYWDGLPSTRETEDEEDDREEESEEESEGESEAEEVVARRGALEAGS